MRYSGDITLRVHVHPFSLYRVQPGVRCPILVRCVAKLFLHLLSKSIAYYVVPSTQQGEELSRILHRDRLTTSTKSKKPEDEIEKLVKVPDKQRNT